MVGMGADGGNVVLSGAQRVSQPGDGSCLFHSLNFGMKKCGASAPGTRQLRRELASWTVQNANKTISETPVKDWIKWDANCGVNAYAKKMQSSGSWGGGIEMAAFSHKMKLDVHVYESMRGGKYKRISCFNVKGNKQTVHVLYAGRMHFDALIPGSGGGLKGSAHSFQQRSPFGQNKQQRSSFGQNKQRSPFGQHGKQQGKQRGKQHGKQRGRNSGGRGRW
jgi:hypothetical protein